jgi:hypothetical protein
MNRLEDALTLRPHVTITVDRDLTPLAPLLRQLHPAILVDGNQIEMDESAVGERRRVLTMLLGAGYDISNMEYSRMTLAQLYAEAVR